MTNTNNTYKFPTPTSGIPAETLFKAGDVISSETINNTFYQIQKIPSVITDLLIEHDSFSHTYNTSTSESDLKEWIETTINNWIFFSTVWGATSLVYDDSGTSTKYEVGAKSTPVYFKEGIPTQCSTSLIQTVSLNVGTDSTYSESLWKYGWGGNSHKHLFAMEIVSTSGAHVSCIYMTTLSNSANVYFVNAIGYIASTQSTTSSLQLVKSDTEMTNKEFGRTVTCYYYVA